MCYVGSSSDSFHANENNWLGKSNCTNPVYFHHTSFLSCSLDRRINLHEIKNKQVGISYESIVVLPLEAYFKFFLEKQIEFFKMARVRFHISNIVKGVPREI